MSNSKQFCIEPDADATWTFGQNIAINDKYLAISDLVRNKVIVYTPDNSGQWQKTREILPPVDLDLSHASSWFAQEGKVYRGEVQNGFLFTQKIDDSYRVCIEPLPKN